jgi:nucleoid-associated protein YgaU
VTSRRLFWLARPFRWPTKPRYTAIDLTAHKGSARPGRRSLRVPRGGVLRIALGLASLGLVVACGGPPAATSTPTAAATTGVAVAPAASPQRPALASPAPSPSAAVSVAAATPTTGAAAVEAGGETYEVQSGDTLASIAQQQYGDGTQWRRIYDANKDAIGADPDKLKLGMQLKIPPKQP